MLRSRRQKDGCPAGCKSLPHHHSLPIKAIEHLSAGSKGVQAGKDTGTSITEVQLLDMQIDSEGRSFFFATSIEVFYQFIVDSVHACPEQDSIREKGGSTIIATPCTLFIILSKGGNMAYKLEQGSMGSYLIACDDNDPEALK